MDNTTTPTMLKWEGRWDQLVGKVKSTWNDVTDDDIEKAQGDYKQLVGIVKEKVGLSLEEVEKALDEDIEVVDETDA